VDECKPLVDGMEQSVVNYYDPEFLRSGAATKEADIYSMGVILLELLTSFKGQVPRLDADGQTESVAMTVNRGTGLHSFPFPLNLSLRCPCPLNLSIHCPPYTPD